jgi:hypothetical protein
MSTAAVNEKKVQTLAERIIAETTIDNATGVGAAPDDLYERTLPEDLTMETVTKVTDHNTTFIAAATDAAGKLAVKAMKENKDLQRATVPFNMGVRDQVTVSVDRKATYPNPQKPEEPIVKFGATTVKYDVRSSHNVGVLKSVRAEISKLAAESLK